MTETLPQVRPQDEPEIIHRTEQKLQDETVLRAAGNVITHVRTLFRMIRDRSFTMTWATRGMILGALLYFVIPTDATPDFIPMVGYIDDAVVLGFVVRRLSREIDRYREHVAWS